MVVEIEAQYIPGDVKWFVAQIVLQIRVADEGTLGHVNYLLIQARSLQEAYRKARGAGRLEESRHLNKRGHEVVVQFLGLKSLTPVYEELADGSEILYEEITGADRGDLRSLAKSRSELTGPEPSRPRSAPDYGYPEIEREAKLLAKQIRNRKLKPSRK